ncbi:MAG: hypothetical protein VKP63_01880 [Cyanobacteriota bacterium]|nr:hypothetical protein [Cyanobacteriota bacterium]
MTLATGGLMLALSLTGPSAKAQTQTCMSGLPISTIVATGLTGYTCQLGTITYTFSSDISELNLPSLTGTLDFLHTPTSQAINFSNLEFQGFAQFSYTATSTTDTITSILQTFAQTPPSPDPIESNVFATVPSTVVSVMAVLETDMSPPVSLRPKVTSLTHNISMIPVPGPLPVMGTALALSVSRKLRKRIQQAHSLEHHSSGS